MLIFCELCIAFVLAVLVGMLLIIPHVVAILIIAHIWRESDLDQN
jgi:hypothetical protein